jgi:hypothetical protein
MASTTVKSFLLPSVVLLLAAMTAGAADAPAAGPAASPFDERDPEIVAIKKLEWKSVDINKLDLRTRCVSLIVLNKILDRVGSKAALREDLLMTFIEQNNLGDEYAQRLPGPGEQAHVTYEESQQIAAAALKLPRIAAQFGDDMDGVEGPVLENYFAMYTKTCLRNWAEMVESRCAVRSMAKFLEAKGMLPAFDKWAGEEMQRKQAAHDEEMKKRQAAYVQTEAENQKKREEIAARNKEESAISAASYAMSRDRMLERPDRGDGSYSIIGGGDYGIWGGSYYPGAYWAGGAYRTGVRDRYNGRWGGGARVGGVRGGGRR